MSSFASQSDSPESRDGALDQGMSMSKPKKSRTRTGCHTCRTRRVKCGEERPACQNCIRAKRECSGYGQRIIFRDPLNRVREPMNGQPATFNADIQVTTNVRQEPPEIQSQRPNKAVYRHKLSSGVLDTGQPSTKIDGQYVENKLEPSTLQHVPQQMYHSHTLPHSILTTNKPPPHTRYLEDPRISEIFRHFIESTSAIFSLFERVSYDHGIDPDSQLVSRNRGLWTYIMPNLALTSPPLMHAMVAMSALHTAKTQDRPPVESLKHYGLAVRTLRKAMSSPSKNSDPAALGATLVLAYYELMSSEHTKWTRHLHGARQLLDGIQFLEIAEQLKSTRRTTSTNLFSEQSVENGLDVSLINAFMGLPLEQRLHESALRCKRSPSQSEYDRHDMLADLFWFVRRQDMAQSIIGGGPLIFDYSHWIKCLPRTSMGYEDDPCGTGDHLVLIMSRLAAFANRDQARKAQLLEALGGSWQPPPGLRFDEQSRLCTSQPEYSVVAQANPGEIILGDYQEQQRRKHSSFADMEDLASSYPRLIGSEDIDASTFDAHSEWSSIRHSLRLFESHLGAGYQALSHSDMVASPFGAAVEFRGLDVAVIWNLYYAGLVMLQRVHPSMPPSPHQAAGICAILTSSIANTIGRISAGICSWSSRTVGGTLLPQLQAALFESTIPMYYAGIQFEDGAQRHWLIQKLLQIAKITGFDSASAVAAGCETGWRVAASLGRGPPYERVMQDSTHRDSTSSVGRGDGEIGDDRGRQIAADDNDMLGGRSIEDCKIVVWEPDGARAHWSLGVIEVEKQAEVMGIQINKKP